MVMTVSHFGDNTETTRQAMESFTFEPGNEPWITGVGNNFSLYQGTRTAAVSLYHRPMTSFSVNRDGDMNNYDSGLV